MDVKFRASVRREIGDYECATSWFRVGFYFGGIVRRHGIRATFTPRGGYQSPDPQPGQPGAQMQLEVFMKPMSVSLAHVMIIERFREATNISGCFADTIRFPDPPLRLAHWTTEHAVLLGMSNSWVDSCWIPPNWVEPLPTGGWTNGAFTWHVPGAWARPIFSPNEYDPIRHSLATEMGASWDQVFSLDDNGTVSIVKFKHNKVTRGTNGVVTSTDNFQP